MTTDARTAVFPSMPPTFGWRRVVELAEAFRMHRWVDGLRDEPGCTGDRCHYERKLIPGLWSTQ
jgi:hypothetical protein